MKNAKELIEAKEKYKHIYLNPLTPLDFLKRSELVFPKKKAVAYRDKSYTWEEFAGRVYSLARGLRDKGIKKNDRVAVLSRNNNAMLESYYGIGMAGGVSVPLNYRLNAKDIAYILNHSESKALIFERMFAGTIRKIQPKLETVELFIEIDSPDKEAGWPLGFPYEEFLEKSSCEPMEVPVEDENDMLSIAYTSGTTGQPKGCVYTHRGAYLNALGEVLAAQMNSESSYLWTLPMFHCQGWCFVWGVTAIGAKHVCLDAVREEQIYKLMDKEDVTHMCGAPTVYAVISDYMSKNGLRVPRTIRGFMAAAPPSLKNISDAESIGLDIHHVYGLTECYGPHTICEWHSSEWDALSLAKRARIKARQGVPYPTCPQVKVVDGDMNEVPWDGETRGEIIMRGNNVMQGYFKEPDKTDEAFRGGWFHSEDAAVVHPDGYIEIVDRLKDIIISGGENVSSIEVESVIAEHPAIFDVAVIGNPDNKWGEIVKAIVKVNTNATVTKEEIVQFCRERLAGFKVPREVEFGDIPRTSTGKIKKNVLKKREREAVAARSFLHNAGKD